MFERYTEKARRVIFFARYEASRYGSPDINSEHLLLGLLREDKALGRWLPKTNPETIAQQIDDHFEKAPIDIHIRRLTAQSRREAHFEICR